MKKLIKIQAELKAPKNQRNNFGKYNYRSCEDILEAVKPLLKEHDCTITITDEIKEVGGIVFVESTVVFNNGNASELLEVKAQAGINPDRKGMDIAQSFGSSSSYARKYALNGLFLIDDTKDADATNDHGNAPKKATPKPQPKPVAKAVPMGERVKVEKDDAIYKKIVAALSSDKSNLKTATEKYNISEDVQEFIKAEVILTKGGFEKGKA